MALAAMAGCSFALSGPDPNRPAGRAPECDTGKGLVGLDGVIGGTMAITSLALLGADEGGAAALTGLLGVAFIASAVRGNTAVNECRTALADYSPRPNLGPPSGPPAYDEPRVAAAPPRPRSQPPTVMQPPADPYADDPAAPAPPPVAPSGPPTKAGPMKPWPQPANKPVPAPAPEPDDWKDFWTEVP